MLHRRQVIRCTCATLFGLALDTPANARDPTWPQGARGAVSLTYDDALDSQLDIAVPALDALKLRATFFVTLDGITSRHAEWEALASRGHELADHTAHHPCDLARRDAGSFGRLEILPTERWLDQVSPGRRVRGFAYPCDVTNLGGGTPNQQERRYDKLLRSLGIESARTSEGLPNRPATVRRRPHRLQALAVGYDATDLPAVRDYLDLAARRGQWAIFVFHAIGQPGGDAGTVSEQAHRSILQEIASGPLWCAPLGEVFLRIRGT